MRLLNSDLRKTIVNLVYSGGGGHIPSSFSIVDIINYIYANYDVLPNQKNKAQNVFTLSKGHGACALYSVLFKFGLISENEIKSYLKYDSILGGHPDATKIHGAEASTGSLGHGLSFTVGRALASKIKNENKNYFVLVGDGECHEGTVWESAIVANNLNLNNLLCLVDYNKSSDQICPHNSLIKQFKSFGWYTIEANGHDEKSIRTSINQCLELNLRKPKCIIFNTIKGKGVSFLEGHGPWHYKIPNKEEYNKIMEELGF